MPLNIHSKNVYFIEDCRQLSYIECIGLIQHGIIFDLVHIIDKNLYSDFYNFIWIEELKKYIFSCDPKNNTCTIKFEGVLLSTVDTFSVTFTPDNEFLKIYFKSDFNSKVIAELTYSAEELIDLFL